MAAHHHIFQRAHMSEQADVLEGARQAFFGDGVRWQAVETLAVQVDFAAAGHVKSGDAVE